MRKITWMFHISLDGFVAGINGELNDFDAGEENLQFVASLTNDADAAMFGRISYELLEGYWPKAKEIPNASAGTVQYSRWYAEAEKIVLSRTLPGLHSKGKKIINEFSPEEMAKIKEGPGQNIILFGSPSIAKLLMEHHLIDQYWVFINPTIFGKGIPAFTQLDNKINLRLLNTRSFSNGEVALHFQVDESLG